MNKLPADCFTCATDFAQGERVITSTADGRTRCVGCHRENLLERAEHFENLAASLRRDAQGLPWSERCFDMTTALHAEDEAARCRQGAELLAA